MRWIILVAMLCAGSLVRAQQAYNLPARQAYPKAIVGLKKFGRTNVTDLRITGDSIFYLVGAARTPHAEHLDDVKYLRVRVGDYAALGAGVGLLTGLSAGLPLAQEARDTRGGKPGRVALVGAAIGAGVGGLIGVLCVRRRLYYVHVRGG